MRAAILEGGLRAAFDVSNVPWKYKWPNLGRAESQETTAQVRLGARIAVRRAVGAAPSSTVPLLLSITRDGPEAIPLPGKTYW